MLETNKGWNNELYLNYKEFVTKNIDSGVYSCFDYMLIYQEQVSYNNYEYCKAITKVLKRYGYMTHETHKFIACLN